MTRERIPEDLSQKLAQAVRRMRTTQKEWFAGNKTPARLDRCRAYERDVDEILREIDSYQQVDLFATRQGS